MSVSPENKALARYVSSVLGMSPSIRKYWDDNHRSSVDILSVSDDAPVRKITYCTLGLSDSSIGLEVDEIPLRVEILLTARPTYDCAPNLLATCAFNVINSQMRCGPDVIFKDVVRMYRAQRDMRHVLFVDPFLWNLKTQSFPTKRVAFLLAVAISESEMEFADKRGIDRLKQVFEEQSVDVSDWDRQSVV